MLNFKWPKLNSMKKNFLSEPDESNDFTGFGSEYYTPPIIEVIEISVEKGFASSTEEWDGETW